MVQLLPDASVAVSQLTVSSSSNTQTFTYPNGTQSSSFGASGDHKITSRDFDELSAQLGHITITFNAADITVVNNGERSFKAGQILHLSLDVAGYDGSGDVPAVGVQPMKLVVVDLGTPVAADPNGAVESQACNSTTGLATGINGALATASVATFDVPRGIVAAWTTTSVLTVTGTDVDGTVIVESSASGTSLAGKKAFKTITGVTCSVSVTGLTVGHGKVLGLPVFLQDIVDSHQQREDGAVPTAGTVVAAVQTDPQTALTGDIRGTYAPNSAPDGSARHELICFVRSASFRGNIAQFGG